MYTAISLRLGEHFERFGVDKKFNFEVNLTRGTNFKERLGDSYFCGSGYDNTFFTQINLLIQGRHASYGGYYAGGGYGIEKL